MANSPAILKICGNAIQCIAKTSEKWDLVAHLEVYMDNSEDKLTDVGFANNVQARCACVLVLDTSASMSGPPIQALNQGLQLFYQDIRQDIIASERVEVAIVTFGHGGVKVVQDFTTLGTTVTFDTTFEEDEYDTPTLVGPIQAPTLVAGGLTPMGAAINTALDMLQKRKAIYNRNSAPYYRPWMFLITDGSPNDNWQGAAERVQREEKTKGVTFFAVGVGEGANMQVLSQISTRPPLILQGLKFAELFLWLSNSQKRVSASQIGEKVALPPPDSWGFVSS
jgi:uncharacterized protein YegL